MLWAGSCDSRGYSGEAGWAKSTCLMLMYANVRSWGDNAVLWAWQLEGYVRPRVSVFKVDTWAAVLRMTCQRSVLAVMVIANT